MLNSDLPRPWAVTKSGMGTWELGCGDLGMWGLGDMGSRDPRTRGRDKQATPDFCAECV